MINIIDDNVVSKLVEFLKHIYSFKQVPKSNLVKKFVKTYLEEVDNILVDVLSKRSESNINNIIDNMMNNLEDLNSEYYTYTNSVILSSKRLSCEAINVFVKNDVNFEEKEDYLYSLYHALEHIVIASLINENKLVEADNYRRSLDTSVKEELTNKVYNFLMSV